VKRLETVVIDRGDDLGAQSAVDQQSRVEQDERAQHGREAGAARGSEEAGAGRKLGNAFVQFILEIQLG